MSIIITTDGNVLIRTENETVESKTLEEARREIERRKAAAERKAAA